MHAVAASVQSPALVVGVGNPTVDHLFEVTDAFLEAQDIRKESVDCISKEKFLNLLSRIQQAAKLATGGCCGNTVRALQKLQMRAIMSGRLGNDRFAEFYKAEMAKIGLQVRASETSGDTQQIAVLITPDHKRTCVAYLGVAPTLCRDDFSSDLFTDAKLAYCEGFLLLNDDKGLLGHAMQQAKAKGARVALNICDTLVVNLAKEKVKELCESVVDVLFANEEEAKAYTGKENAEEACTLLASQTKATVVVTAGATGCYVGRNDTVIHKPANKVNVVDTTGAGDLFAAGFLFGLLRGDSLEECARKGNFIGGKIVGHVGTDLPADEWAEVNNEFHKA